MVTPKKTTANFNAIFNDLIGSRTGEVWDAKTGSPKPTRAGSIKAAKKYQRAKSVDLGLDDRAVSESMDSGRWSNRGTSQPEDVNVSPNIESLQGPDLQKALDDLFGGQSFIERNVINKGKSLLGTVGELASRPIYAVNNANLKFQQALDEGQNPLGTFDDIGYGAWRGFTGKDKTTPGDFLEYASDPDVDRSKRGTFGDIASFIGNPYNAIGGVPSGMNQMNLKARENLGTNNAISRNVNRVLAFGGETIGDPANLLGGKALGVLGRGAEAGSLAKTASVDAIESLYDDVAEAAAKGIPSIEGKVVRGGRAAIDGSGTIRGGTTKITEKVSTQMADAADAAILTPSGTAVAANNARTVQAVAVKGVTEARNQILKKFETALTRIKSGGLKVGSKEYDRLVKNDPVLKAFDDAYQEALNPKNLNPQSMASREELIDVATKAARESIDEDLVRYAKNLEDQLNASMYNTFSVRVGTRDIPLNFLGRGYAAARQKLPRVGAPKPFSYSKQLPGLMGDSVGNARRIGHVNYENFLREMRPIARQYDAADRAAISRYIHNFTDPDTFADDLLTVPEHLREGIQAIKNDYDNILREELEAGVRSGTDEVPFNYQYLHFNYDDFRPGATGRRTAQDELKGRGDFRGRGTRKAEVSQTGNIVTGPEQARAMGLKPVEDPFEALAQRRLRSERLKSRSTVTDSFFRTYGISDATMDAKTARDLGLVKVASPDQLLRNSDGGVRGVSLGNSNYKVNRTLQGYMNTTGESLYLPKDVAEAYENYIKLADVNTSEELSSYLRLYDKVLNTFKMSATVPFPGFHVKNMAGDIYMGYLDGVRAMDYTRYIRGSKSGTFKFRNGTEMSVEDFNTLFSRHGKSGGFVEQELFPSTKMGGDSILGTFKTAGDKVRTASEIREDFGRKVHFFHALDEELAAKSVKGINPADISRQGQKVLDNATYRINKFKFDYGALTSTEKAVMRRIIPFYTFLRKSTPLMLEGMLLNPSQYGKTYRFFGDEEGFGPRAAQWQRELGFANPFGNGDEPLLFPSNIFPTDSITSWGKDPFSLSNYSDNFINSMNPMLKAPIELGMGRSTFTGQELFDGQDPSLLQQGRYILDGIIPGVKTVEKDIVQPALKSAGLREDDNVEGFFEDPLARFFGSRLGMGLGARRLDSESQRRNVNSEMGWYDQELKKFSEGIKDYGIKVFLSRRSGGNSIKVRTLDGKKTLYDGDLQGALEVVANYTNNPRNKVQEGDEIVNYVDGETGAVKRNRPAREMTSLDRVLDF